MLLFIFFFLRPSPTLFFLLPFFFPVILLSISGIQTKNNSNTTKHTHTLSLSLSLSLLIHPTKKTRPMYRLPSFFVPSKSSPLYFTLPFLLLPPSTPFLPLPLPSLLSLRYGGKVRVPPSTLPRHVSSLPFNHSRAKEMIYFIYFYLPLHASFPLPPFPPSPSLDTSFTAGVFLCSRCETYLSFFFLFFSLFSLARTESKKN